MWILSKRDVDVLTNFIVSLISILVWISPTNGTITVVSLHSNESVATIDDTPASFLDQQVLDDGIEGFLVQSEPPNACTPVQSIPTGYFPPNVSFILITQNSDCDVEIKIENAQKAGYIGIIIHNVNSNTSDVDSVEVTNTNISSRSSDRIYICFVGEHDGHRLITYSFPSEKWYYIKITNYSLLGNFIKLVEFVALWCATWFVLWCVYRLFCWIAETCCSWPEQPRVSTRSPDMRPISIDDFPISKWVEGDPYETCVVCLEDFVLDDTIRALPCSHGFHSVCIDRWLTRGANVCPICKRIILLEGLPYLSDTDTDDDEAPILQTPSTSNTRRLNLVSSTEYTFLQNLQSFLRSSQGPRTREEDSSDSSTTSTSSSGSGSSWTTMSGSVGTEIGSGPTHQSLTALAQVQVPTVPSQNLPSSSGSQRHSARTRAQVPHLSNFTPASAPALGRGHGHGDVTVAISNNHNINMDSDAVTGHIRSYFYTSCQEEPEDEEMLDCSVEVTVPESESPCVVVMDSVSTLPVPQPHNTIL